MVSCNKCQTTLKWKQPYRKGDRPINLNGTAHNCERSNPSQAIALGVSKHDYKHCDFCPGECGWLDLNKPEEIAEHMRKFHPNEEVRSWDYFQV